MQKANRISHDLNLDILRWIAALTVVFHHLTNSYNKTLFDKRFFLGDYLTLDMPGHLSVLVFFVLSGYVISRNTRQLTNKQEIAQYARKRLVRIFPIYIVAVLLVVAIKPGTYSLPVILSNLFCVSVPLDNVLNDNQPLWSLNYELLYYLVFIIISYFQISLRKLLYGLLVITALLFVTSKKIFFHPLIISYIIGFAYWIAGAMIAKSKNLVSTGLRFSRKASLIALFLCLEYFYPIAFEIFAKAVHLTPQLLTNYSWFQQSIKFADIAYLPYCMLVIYVLTNAGTRFLKMLFGFTYGIILLLLLKLVWIYGTAYFVQRGLVAPCFIFVLSLVLWLSNFSIGQRIAGLIKSTGRISEVSYALYIVHYPVIVLFGRIETPGVGYWILKLIVFFALLFGLSYFLELKYQPFVKKKLLG